MKRMSSGRSWVAGIWFAALSTLMAEPVGTVELADRVGNGWHMKSAVTVHEDGRIDGVFVASDKGRHQRLYYYSMTLMLSIFRSVGLDVVSEQHLVRDPETEQWKIR